MLLPCPHGPPTPTPMQSHGRPHLRWNTPPENDPRTPWASSPDPIILNAPVLLSPQLPWAWHWVAFPPRVPLPYLGECPGTRGEGWLPLLTFALVTVPQRNRANRIHRHVQAYLKELPHAISCGASHCEICRVRLPARVGVGVAVWGQDSAKQQDGSCGTISFSWGEPNLFFFLFPFLPPLYFLLKVFNWLDQAHPPCGESSSFLKVSWL